MERLLEQQAEDGVAVYSRWVLNIYDAFVLGYNNRYVWRCPTARTLALYERYTSRNHLDVGVGTGYYLHRATLAAGQRRVALMDMSENCLAYAAERLRRYRPERHRANILDALPAGIAAFDSVSLCYVLHCIPGDMAVKEAAFKNLASIMNRGGTLFGTTLLPHSAAENWQSRLQMKLYNRRGIFHNERDTLGGLQAALSRHFAISSLDMVGCAAVFVARKVT